MVSLDQNPESTRTVSGPVAPARRTRAIELVEEAAGAALGVGLALAHPGVQHLTGVGAGGEDRVVAEHLGVAEPGALLGLPSTWTDRRVDIDHQRPVARSGTGRPGPFEHPCR